MKLFLAFLAGAGDLLLTILWMPVHLRNYLQAKTHLAHAQAILAQEQGLQANATVMMHLWALGSDTRPLARHVAELLHNAYGVRPSSISPGEVVPMPGRGKK